MPSLGTISPCQQAGPGAELAVVTLLTVCLIPINTSRLYMLAGIGPPDVRRAVASQIEHLRVSENERYPLHGHSSDPFAA